MDSGGSRTEAGYRAGSWAIVAGSLSGAGRARSLVGAGKARSLGGAGRARIMGGAGRARIVGERKREGCSVTSGTTRAGSSKTN